MSPVDEDLNRRVSAAIVEIRAGENTSVGLYASYAWFQPELSAALWPSGSRHSGE
ncbi:hypothetical protein [Nocardia sp. alder85J]|uniref:hypothetical protein n=1 Tax=Nocardia sp. alder85J TaxID=2862949 RepID=UPI001CD640A1|nr:hypothetical protein [Nocardia sp. alder85J]MCX4093666.1 hypothetical protein [Nocardia sp. alder85J]